MSGFAYEASSPLKTLAKECKKFLLNDLNAQVQDGQINDPIFGCSIKGFHGHHLAWNKAQWEDSAEVVYQYFKAASLIRTIKEYEQVFGKTIVYDYNALLEFVYESLSKGEEIVWSRAPSLGKDFYFVPEKVLEDKLNRFKELYE